MIAGTALTAGGGVVASRGTGDSSMTAGSPVAMMGRQLAVVVTVAVVIVTTTCVSAPIAATRFTAISGDTLGSLGTSSGGVWLPTVLVFLPMLLVGDTVTALRAVVAGFLRTELPVVDGGDGVVLGSLLRFCRETERVILLDALGAASLAIVVASGGVLSADLRTPPALEALLVPVGDGVARAGGRTGLAAGLAAVVAAAVVAGALVAAGTPLRPVCGGVVLWAAGAGLLKARRPAAAVLCAEDSIDVPLVVLVVVAVTAAYVGDPALLLDVVEPVGEARLRTAVVGSRLCARCVRDRELADVAARVACADDCLGRAPVPRAGPGSVRGTECCAS